MFICLPTGNPRCRWLCFFSRTQTKIYNSNHCNHLMAVNGTHGFESKKKNIHRPNQIKPCGPWQYTEVLRHETISLCKKLIGIYIYFYLYAQLSWQQLVRDGSMCSGIVDACTEAICRSYTSLIVYTIHLVLSVYVLFTLKAVGPIDCHYMTDRLQRFELKHFVCVLKKQSHLHLGCPGVSR